MGTDRIVLGQHANTSLGAGLFVSLPGANVMHPEHAQFGNLMFDTNAPQSSLNIIQTGTFAITCSRKAISPRGQTVGSRNDDTFEIHDIDAPPSWSWKGSTPPNVVQSVGFVHNFKHDTGRPSALSSVTNATYFTSSKSQWRPAFNGIIPGVSDSGKNKQGNYLDTGSQTIAIASPLPNGEIPEVALRFAVGNSSGHFHPWYANTKILPGRTGGNWNDIDYASGNTQQIVHMDSNWMRLKWGGLGEERYSGTQEEVTVESLNKFWTNPSKWLEMYGFNTEEEAQQTIGKNSKLMSLAITNSQGIVGLIPYINSTSITVDAYMSPTHAGIRTPIDRTYNTTLWDQMGVGKNAIDDFAHINFPLETSQHTNNFFHNFIQKPGGSAFASHAGGVLVETDPFLNYSSLGGWNGDSLFGDLSVTGPVIANFRNYSGWADSSVNVLGGRPFNTLPGASNPTAHNIWYFHDWPEYADLSGYPELNKYRNSEGEQLGLFGKAHFPNSPVIGYQDGKVDMYGWGGHPTEFFVNPFSNSTCTFYTHMQPPYLHNKTPNTSVASGYTYTGQYLPIEYENETGVWGPTTAGPWHSPEVITPFQVIDQTYNAAFDLDADLAASSPNPIPAIFALFGSSVFYTGALPNNVEGLKATPTNLTQHMMTQPMIGGAHNYFAVIGEYWNSLDDGTGLHYIKVDDEIIKIDSVDGATFLITPTIRIYWYVITYTDTTANRAQYGTSIATHDPLTCVVELVPQLEYTDSVTTGGPGANETQWELGTARNPRPDTFNGAGIKWPPGHHLGFADYLDYRDWTGSMGLAGAGSKEAMAMDDVWDTFYCSYTVYSTGSAPTKKASQAPVTIDVNCYATPGLNGMPGGGSGHMHNASKLENEPGASPFGQKYYNLVFPDDFVKTVGDPLTDPFHAHRDYTDPNQRIYGNVNILFKIPKQNPDNTNVHIESKIFNWTPNINQFFPGINFPEFTGKPAPAITFDLGDSKFTFEENKDLSITIENYGVVLGGGGSGGLGDRIQSFVVSDADTEQVKQQFRTYGGGGGGSGGGSGPFPDNPPNPGIGFFEDYGHAQGVGMGGSGWAQLPSVSGFENLNGIVEAQKGKNGNDIVSDMNNRLKCFQIASGGGAAPNKADWSYYARHNEPNEGGDGGDAIYINHGTVTPVVYIVNKRDSGAALAEDGVFVSGGGGGGGGKGYYNFGTSTHAKGADGAGVGIHGNPTQGSPGSSQTSIQNEPVQYEGGDAGYLVGGKAAGLYPGRVRITNESRLVVRGKHPSAPVVKGTIGFALAVGTSADYE